MKAAFIDRYGSNDRVSVADIALPLMGPLDLLVQVHAASVNPLDVKTRDGKFKMLLKYQFPLVLGNDLSGVVSDVGAQVTRFKKGDAVYARLDRDRIGARHLRAHVGNQDRKSTRLNSSHDQISYAVFCLKKK